MSNLGKILKSAGRHYVPSVVGEVWGGGYYAGRMKVAGQAYVVIVSPYALGYNGSLVTMSSGTLPAGLSEWDGGANHDLMVAAGLSRFPAAQWCAGLNIGGFSDWHVPAEYELDICYRAFRPANSPSTSIGANVYADPAKGNYTNTDPAATNLPDWMLNGSEAYVATNFLTSTPTSTTNVNIMNFNGGTRLSVAASGARMVRATRLVKVYD